MNGYFSDHVIRFYRTIRLPETVPAGIEVMHPHLLHQVATVAEQFYQKFYADNRPRTFIIGINPGRYGGGVTGIPFTDPVKLKLLCEVPHQLEGKTELSADFIYQVIAAYGGPAKFYQKFYFTSVSPLGFTKNGLNLNYYDDKNLIEVLLPFMQVWMSEQLRFGANQNRCICLGSGKNMAFLHKLNLRYNFFKRIDVLDHPRFIMQYKRKTVEDYISKYLQVLDEDE